jgi:hypothetical protein
MAGRRFASRRSDRALQGQRSAAACAALLGDCCPDERALRISSPPAGVKRWNNPTYGYRVLRAMSDSGLVDRAVAHLIERYSPY